MPHIHRPRYKSESLDPNRCCASVYDGRTGFYQCTKPGTRAWTDPKTGTVHMFCTGRLGHHPDDEAARGAESQARWVKKEAADQRQRVQWGLAKATDDELRAECQRRGLFREDPKQE